MPKYFKAKLLLELHLEKYLIRRGCSNRVFLSKIHRRSESKGANNKKFLMVGR